MMNCHLYYKAMSKMIISFVVEYDIPKWGDLSNKHDVSFVSI